MDIDTEGYKRLMHILGVVSHDTWQLFEDMHAYNPYAREKREAFIAAMTDIHERLNYMKVAFQGEHGAYSEVALYEHFGNNVEAVGCDTFDDVFDLVNNEEVTYGFIPVENTIARHRGWRTTTFFLPTRCLSSPRHICPSVTPCWPKKGARIEDIKEAFSHPHALKQCKAFLKSKGISA